MIIFLWAVHNNKIRSDVIEEKNKLSKEKSWAKNKKMLSGAIHVLNSGH